MEVKLYIYYTGCPKKCSGSFLSKMVKYGWIFMFVRWIVCPQSSFEREVYKKNSTDFGPNRQGHENFAGVSWDAIKFCVLWLVLYLCSQKGGNLTFLQKKSFLEIWHLMNIHPNPMIFGHELDPVNKTVCSFFNTVCNLPHFLSVIRLTSHHGQSDFAGFLVYNGFAHFSCAQNVQILSEIPSSKESSCSLFPVALRLFVGQFSLPKLKKKKY